MTGRVSGTARAAGGWGPFDRLRANGVVDGGCDGWVAGVGGWGMRWGETPRALPLWIPAFAGMTGRVSGTARAAGGWGPFDRLRANGVVDGGCDGVGGCVGGRRPAPRPSGFLPSQE